MYGTYGLTLFIFGATSVLGKLDQSLLTEDLKTLMATLHKTCVDQIGIDEGQIDKLKEAVFENDEKSKCYVKCIMSESGVMDENGQIDFDALAEIMPEKLKEKTKATGEICVKRAEGINNKNCEKAYKILQCSSEVDPENYFCF